jgi:hypothetical protein
MAAVRDWTFEEVCRVVALRGDVAALGGAVTVALCGHWEHDGPCRWPHHTMSVTTGDDVVATTVRFDALPSEEQQVRQLIRDALAAGSLSGPDNTTTTWRLAP